MIYGMVCNSNKQGTDTCYNNIGLCAQHINKIMDSIVYTIGSASLITSKKENLAPHFLIPKLKMAISMIHSC